MVSCCDGICKVPVTRNEIMKPLKISRCEINGSRCSCDDPISNSPELHRRFGFKTPTNSGPYIWSQGGLRSLGSTAGSALSQAEDSLTLLRIRTRKLPSNSKKIIASTVLIRYL